MACVARMTVKQRKIKAVGGAIITVEEGSLGMNVKDREEV
mgnify:FL=1